nr:OF24903 [Phoebe bournei]
MAVESRFLLHFLHLIRLSCICLFFSLQKKWCYYDQGFMDQRSSPSPSTPGSTDSIESRIRALELPPITNITRIMRRAIPANGKIEQEAKEFMQECVSEFIGLITLEANEKSSMESRRTITADDVVAALNSLNFDNYARLSSRYLERYRESQTTSGPQTAALMGQEARGLQTACQEMHGGSVNRNGQQSSSGSENAMQE